MKEDVVVSIIVPIYNVEKYLEKCLSSIREQSYKNIQVIMVNDGSTDSSAEIAKRFSTIDNRFLLIDKENGGLSSARNCGMKYIRGEYVSFIDSDDFIDYNYVRSLLDAFEEDIDIVIADYVIYDYLTEKSYLHGNLLENELFTGPEDKPRLMRYLLYGVYPVMPVWKNMYKASFLQKNNLMFESEREIYAEDLVFHINAYSCAQAIRIIDEKVYYHLIVNNSLSQGYRKNFYQMNKALYYRVLATLEEYYDSDFVLEYKCYRPAIIGGALFHSCKCGFSEAVHNVRNIISDSFVQDAFIEHLAKTGPVRYWLLYRIGMLKEPVISVLFAKAMLLTNPLYRLLQKKDEYKKKGVLQNGAKN